MSLDAQLLAERLLPWFERERRELPWRAPDAGAWAVLVSEIMLQQTQVARVEPKYRAFLARWPRPLDLAHAPTPELLALWQGLGYPRRALALQRAAVSIVDHHGGTVPDDLDALLALPGIGDYTARAVLAFAFGQRHAVVDTNVRRVIARARDGVAHVAPSAREHRELAALLPEDQRSATVLAAAIMELGALVCTARTPSCTRCPLSDVCAWRAAGYPEATRTVRTQAAFAGSVRQARGMLLRALLDAGGSAALTELRLVVPDDRFAPALDGLVRDGLAVRLDGAVALPD